jgi:uncharacterized protein
MSAVYKKNITAENKDLNHCIDYLADIFKFRKPLGKFFRTESSCYLYDSGTNKILTCDNFTYSLLEKLYSMDFDAALNSFIKENGRDCFIKTTLILKKSINKHNLFGLYEVTNFVLFPDKEELKESIDTMSNMLGLEVTEQCNLRCLYCVHKQENKEYRIHGKKNMEIETAFAAIDFLRKHSINSTEVSIVFYGGEPLLNFPIIKKSIEYGKRLFTDKKISFSMTTNGTKITPEISRFLFNNNVSVKVSIDGLQDLHDRYRKDLVGNGSFQETLKGLKNLHQAYGDIFKNKISLNLVYAPPFSSDQIDKRAMLWTVLDWISYDMRASISYYTGPRLPGISHEEDKDLLQWAFEKYIINKQCNKNPHPFVKHLMEQFLAVFSQRAIYQEAVKKFALNGCCIPGVRRIFVTASGDFRLCEKIPVSAPVIGNVKDGIDLDVLYRVYLKEYSDMSLKICKNCWAINICDSCFVDGFDDKGMSYEKKTEECKNVRLSTTKKILYFIKVLEIMPDKLEHFQSIKLN